MVKVHIKKEVKFISITNLDVTNADNQVQILGDKNKSLQFLTAIKTSHYYGLGTNTDD